MAKVALTPGLSRGEGGWPSTASIGPYSSRIKINGKNIQLKGLTEYAEHSRTLGGVTVTHPSSQRIIVSGSSTLKIEGYYVARIGDYLGDGDIITGYVSTNTDVGTAIVYMLTDDGSHYIVTESGSVISG